MTAGWVPIALLPLPCANRHSRKDVDVRREKDVWVATCRGCELDGAAAEPMAGVGDTQEAAVESWNEQVKAATQEPSC